MCGSVRARQSAMMCSARLSWRSPPRCRRWRVRVAGAGGDRGGAGVSGEAGVGGEALGAGGVADQDRGGDRAAAVLGEQLRRVSGDQRGRAGSELVALAGDLVDPLQQCSRRSGPGRRRGASRGGARAWLGCAGLADRAGAELRLELGVEREQMPAQPVDRAGALGDELVAIVAEQADLHRLLVEERGREPLDTVSDRGAGDRERVDRDPTSRFALALRGRSPVSAGGTLTTRSPAATSARSRRAGDVPAVLDRPHPLLAERRRATAARRARRRRSPAIVRSPSTPPVAASTAASVCERLCVSTPITIICAVPSLVMADEADLRRTDLSRGDATLLSSHAGGPRAATGDRTKAGQTKRVDRAKESQPAAAREPNPAGRTHRPPPRTLPLRAKASVTLSARWRSLVR